jgi:hypothetical protein
MAIVSIGQLFERAEAFEQKLEEYYAEIRNESEGDGVRLLTYYLSKHRHHLNEALENFTAEQIAKVKAVKLKYDVEFDLEKHFHLMKTAPKEVTGAGLLKSAISHDAELITLYKTILEQPLGEETHTFLESLVRVEERDIVMLKKTLAMNYF